MGNSILRKHIKEVLSEFFNNAWVYTYGPNKFPYLDGADEKTPSDLNAEFDSKFGVSPDEIEETGESSEIDAYSKKNPTIQNKH